MSASAHPAPVPGTDACYHCGQPVPPASVFRVTIGGAARAMCCRGCEAVAQAIVDGGLADFYRHRSRSSPTGHEIVPTFLRQTRLYDNPEVQKAFVRTEGAHVREASLILEGIVCAACVWLNERHIARLPGVLSVSINYATHRARVRWDETRIRLSDILRAVSEIGYLAHPYDPRRAQEILEHERRQHLRRLAVAGVAGMQIMILAVALYVGAWSGIEPEFRTFFRWVSLVLTLPVILYAARPFYLSAWRDLKQRHAGMDVPVSLGLGIAFAGSVWATVAGAGEVYYDSVAMFVFFLLAGRYFELGARKTAAEASEALVRMAPAMATRVIDDTTGWHEEAVAASELRPGDRVLIRPGETAPADARIIEGRSSVDESLLSGESMPITKVTGDLVIGGCINRESPLHAIVEKTGQDTVLSAILRLLDRAQTEKPAVTQAADRVASWFVSAVLMLAAAVGLYWWSVTPEHWLPVTVAVLVVTCPCALSLATPTALTAATGFLTRAGLLATRGHALESLARATHFVFDKTGTLTHGRPHLLSTHTYAALSAAQCVALAARLESHSEHPVARALVQAAGRHAQAPAARVENVPGGGIHGDIDGRRHFVGTPAFVNEHAGLAIAADVIGPLQESGHSVVLLADDRAILAAFVVGDELRPGARELVQELKRLNRTVILLTGDHAHAARRVAEAVGINEFAANLKPEDKLARIKAFQAQGAVVAMCGDGINDAASLAAAHVSIAMGGGTQVAAASADMILLAESLAGMTIGVRTARAMLRIVHQNLAWAAAYNLLALPAAAAGLVAPWMAAIGMSASSFVVVANALRLTRTDHRRGASAATGA